MARTRLGRVLPTIRPPRSASPCRLGNLRKRGLPIATSPRRTEAIARNPRPAEPGFSIRACESYRAKRAIAGPRPANPSSCAFACRAIAPGRSFRTMRLRRSSQSLPPTSRISRCCARPACRPTTWPPAPTTPIYASPHPAWPGTPGEHLQARADLRSAWRRGARCCSPAAADGARRRKAIKARPWPGGERHHLS